MDMAGIQTYGFNWNPRPSAWQEMQTRREKNKAFREDLESLHEAVSSTLSSTWSSQITRSGDLAAKAALARIQAETKAKVKAKQAAADAASSSVWKNKAPPTEVSAGNSKIDLSNNTLTLGDGTVIDIKTGVKKVNLKA